MREHSPGQFQRRYCALHALCAAVVFSVAILVPSAAWSIASPHTSRDAQTQTCLECHALHESGSSLALLRDRADLGTELSVSDFCLSCHDGTNASNVKTGNDNVSFDGTSGHELEGLGTDDPAADLTDTCTGCHGPHSDYEIRFRLPRTVIEIVLPDDSVQQRPVTGADNSWCLACHDDEQSWYASTGAGVYPALSDPTRAEDGYPETGTFPGATVYTSPEANAHGAIPAGLMDDWAMTSREATRVAGDCLWCHSGHRGTSQYDGLVASFGDTSAAPSDTVDGDYAAVCFRCHSADGLVGSAAVDIASVALASEDDPDVFNGHRIRTAGGDLPVNAPLPCYECHNPHGSSQGNARLISDVLGTDLDPSTDDGMRAFCFTCHTSYDENGSGVPYCWDSDTGTYVPVDESAEVAGLPRAADEATRENKLRLWEISRPGHASTDTQNCVTACHIDVHAPMGSMSLGDMECLECHVQLEAMVPGHAQSQSSYHHVLDAENPDQVPGATGEYPVFDSTQKLACVSCHVDHNKYESASNPTDPEKADGRAYNLRSSATVSNPTASNTDEQLCLSCHTYDLGFRIYRDPPDGQKANEVFATSVMRVEADYWLGSPHNYDADGVFNDGSVFKANCAKCHGTLNDSTLSYSEPDFTVHFSPEQRLLNALGDADNATIAVNEEQMCFRCHSTTSDGLSGQIKPDSSYDWYGTQPMSVANTAIYNQMKPAHNQFGHKPASYSNLHLVSSEDETQAYISANKHVECADCHNHHMVGNARHVYGTDNRVSEAIRGVRGVGFKPGELASLAQVNYPTADPISYGTGVNDELEYKQWTTYEYEICFKCHSSANTQLAAWGGPMNWTVWPAGTTATNATVPGWTNVALDFNVGNNSRHPVFANLSGYYYPDAEAASMVQIPGYADTVGVGTSPLEPGQVSNGWGPEDTMMCSDCHGDSDAPFAMIESPAGSGNWIPNPAAVDVPQGPHGSSVRFSLRGPATDWPTRSDTGALIRLVDLVDANYDGLFCTNCHPKARIDGNRAHSAARGLDKHGGQACIYCHVQVPHGGKVSRLIGDHETMPARLAYQGNLDNMKMSSYQKGASTKNTCSVVAGSSCDTHSTGHNTTGNRTGGLWENW